MAAVPHAKIKSVSKASHGSALAKSKSKNKSQTHRRSRTGCFTCRLRRKKCDEGSPSCTACRHLGLQCEYKRPSWWGNNEARRRHKEDIKDIIKRKKLAEKALHAVNPSLSPPPGLCHSQPTSVSYSDPLDRTRSSSIDSQISDAFNFNSSPYGTEYVLCGDSYGHPDFPISSFPPYEIDVKMERQMFVDDVPTLKESHLSTFSHCQPSSPPVGAASPAALSGTSWSDYVPAERRASQSEDAPQLNFFRFSSDTPTSFDQTQIQLEENDEHLLEHFVQHVLPSIFRILDVHQHGPAGSSLVLPALQCNPVYLHCCLSIAAQHLKTHPGGSGGGGGEELDNDVMRHRYATIFTLCESLKQDENHQQMLDATLGLIFFPCVVGRVDDGLLDIAWYQHFQAAVSLVQKLDLVRLVTGGTGLGPVDSFSMALTGWIDIFGATMQGVSPTFAHTFREKHLAQTDHQLGFREIMGCEDRVMYLISEIACLESLKADGMDDFTLCQHVSALGEQISLTEVGDEGPRVAFTAKGSLCARQLSKNMTTAFRLAARIYLCSLVPGFSPRQPSPMNLVEKLSNVLRYIPSGPEGFDRNLVWVYLIAGSMSLPGSSFRALFEERRSQLGDEGLCGSYGRMVTVLREVWAQGDGLFLPSTQISSGDGGQHYVHWRDVMRSKGWEYLLI